MKDSFNKICEFRQQNPAIRSQGLLSNDPSLDNVKKALQKLNNELQSKYKSYKGIGFKCVVSRGSGYYPAILHVSVLPPEQTVSDGVYALVCFDKLGRGAILGCAESKTKSKGLVTTPISKIGSTIDVDGFRDTTKYNNCFKNPKEFPYRMNGQAEKKFYRHLRKSLDEALLYLNVIRQTPLSINQQEELITNDPQLSETMKDALIKSRRGQGKFRQQALTKYGKCCITGLSKKDLLIASHIKPWIVCSNDERLDVANCLLLTPDYDKLFDRGYITFIDGQLRISPKLTSKHRGCLKIKDNFKLNGMTDETKEYMRYHNTYRFKKK